MHKPVLLDAVLSHLNLKSGQIVLDATVGSGGHAKAILEKIGPKGLLIGLDQDEDAVKQADASLKPTGGKFVLKQINFRFLDQALSLLNIERVDAVLLDIGVSSDQLDTAERGFSFSREGPLDMRMDRAQSQTAQHLIYGLNEEELTQIFREYGEERFGAKIARAILKQKSVHPIRTTGDLKRIVEQIVPAKYRFGRTHPATRVFQALRIAVNDELGALEEALPKACRALNSGGRLAVISFHSLEDRMVKRFFIKEKNSDGAKIITKKPVEATEQEVSENPRSRSAKLRVLERT